MLIARGSDVIVNMKIKNTPAAVYQALHLIHERHRRKYRGNPGSGQMCCMWSTYNPPDVIEGTKPFCDIEAAFGISIDEKYAMRLYDMDLYEAAGMIVEMMRNEERKRLTANNRKEDKQ